jgi:hypothetical protein
VPILGVMAIPHDIASVASNWASQGGIQADLPLPCPLPLPPYIHANVCCCDWKSTLSISQNIVKGFDNTNQCAHQRSSCVVENLKARSKRDVRLKKESHGREKLTMISSLLSKIYDDILSLMTSIRMYKVWWFFWTN